MITRPWMVVGLVISPHSKRSWNDSIANAVEAVETTSATAAITAQPFVLNFIIASPLTEHEKKLKLVKVDYLRTLKPVIVRPSKLTSIATSSWEALMIWSIRALSFTANRTVVAAWYHPE